RVLRVTDDVDVPRDLDRREVLNVVGRVVRPHTSALAQAEEGEGEVLLWLCRIPTRCPAVHVGEIVDATGLQVPARGQHLHVADQVKQGLPLPLFDVPRVNQLQVAVDNTTHRVVPRLLRAVRLSPAVRAKVHLL